MTPQSPAKTDRINANEAPESIPQMKLDKLARHRGESFADSQKTPAQKVQHRLTTEKPRGSIHYPKAKYHPHKPHVVVNSPEHEAAIAPAEGGWVDNPADFPPSAVRTFETAEKLAMFDQMAAILDVEEGASPVDALIEALQQRDAFALQIANTGEGEPDPSEEDESDSTETAKPDKKKGARKK